MLLCFLSYFLIVANFLYVQTIPLTLYLIIATVIITATLIQLNDSNSILSVQSQLRLSTTLLVQALPLTIVFFILFPRIPGPFWSLPRDTFRGTTGLSESISLGSISELSLSDKIAFRVKFEGEIPAPSQRYWRGPVLWQTNGQDWKMASHRVLSTQQIPFQPLGKPFDYVVTLEPHHQRWLLGLDLPIKSPPRSQMTADYQIRTMVPVIERLRYQLRSHTQYIVNTLTPAERQLALSLPVNKHLQTRSLAQQWQQELQQPSAIVERALRYFNQQSFEYTLTPPLLESGDPIDEFLFKTRQGFCEHYATSFTILMRAAGIPTRVVTGYLGGNVNPVDDYLIVRQRDAHAWSEVWLEEQGWVRIDPTAAVAPERVQSGQTIVSYAPFGLELDWNENTPIVQLWQQLRNNWDALNNIWNQRILSYHYEQQQLLLERFGLDVKEWGKVVIVLVILMVGLLFITGLSLRHRRESLDPAQQLYLQFCRKLTSYPDLLRRPSEGPLTYAHRISLTRPDLAEVVQQMTQWYIQIRYGEQLQLLPQLRIAVKQFHP
jgi:transglutaminase-like putative cysteine protease